MVAINFPDSPTNGQEHAGYVWDATNNVWNRLPTLPALDLINFSAVAPSNPQDGQFWFDTTVGKMYVYYNDGSSSQWVSAIGGLASQTGTTGQVLTYDGTEWVADDLPASGKILQVQSVLKTDTFSASVTAGDSVAVTDLSITHTLSNASNKLLITAFFGNAANSGQRGQVGLAVADGVTLLALGDTGGSRTSVTTGGRTGADGSSLSVVNSPSATFLYAPGDTASHTYTLHAINPNTATQTIYINRTSGDGDFQDVTRAASALTIMEVAG